MFFSKLASLNITGLNNSSESGEIIREWMFQFTSGATPTVVTFPAGVKSEMIVAPNTVYQCSIVNNLLTFQGWKVSN